MSTAYILWYYQNKSLPYILVIVRNSLPYILFFSCRSHVSRWRARRLTVFNHFESSSTVTIFLLFLFFHPSFFFFLFLPFSSLFPPLLLFFFLFFAPCVSLNCKWWAFCNQSVWILGNHKNQEFKPWEKLRELADNKHFVTKDRIYKRPEEFQPAFENRFRRECRSIR